MKRTKTLGFVMIWVSGLVMYMLLAIFFWLEATAAPLAGSTNDLAFDSIGSMYEMYKSDDEAERMVAFAYTHGAIMGAVTARALAECTDSSGDADYSCIKHRRESFITYMANAVREAAGDATNENLVKVFFFYCVNMEADEVVEVGFIAALFLDYAVDGHESNQ